MGKGPGEGVAILSNVYFSFCSWNGLWLWRGQSDSKEMNQEETEMLVAWTRVLVVTNFSAQNCRQVVFKGQENDSKFGATGRDEVQGTVAQAAQHLHPFFIFTEFTFT